MSTNHGKVHSFWWCKLHYYNHHEYDRRLQEEIKSENTEIKRANSNRLYQRRAINRTQEWRFLCKLLHDHHQKTKLWIVCGFAANWQFSKYFLYLACLRAEVVAQNANNETWILFSVFLCKLVTRWRTDFFQSHTSREYMRVKKLCQSFVRISHSTHVPDAAYPDWKLYDETKKNETISAWERAAINPHHHHFQFCFCGLAQSIEAGLRVWCCFFSKRHRNFTVFFASMPNTSITFYYDCIRTAFRLSYSILLMGWEYQTTPHCAHRRTHGTPFGVSFRLWRLQIVTYCCVEYTICSL